MSNFSANNYHSLDFDVARKRSRQNLTEPGPYLVHAEDFENINDLIARSQRMRRLNVNDSITQTAHDEHVSGAHYETDKEILDQLVEDQLYMPYATPKEAEQVKAEVKQSEDKAVTNSASETQSKAS